MIIVAKSILEGRIPVIVDSMWPNESRESRDIMLSFNRVDEVRNTLLYTRYSRPRIGKTHSCKGWC